MADYFKGEKISTIYQQFVGIGGADDRDGIHATTQKSIWTDDGDGGVNLFPFTAARDAMQYTGTNRLEFNDADVYIHSSSDGKLDLTSDGIMTLGASEVLLLMQRVRILILPLLVETSPFPQLQAVKSI